MSSSFDCIGILLPSLLLFCILTTTTHAEEGHHENLQTYIVHVKPPPPEHTGTDREWHESFLPNSSRLLHSFSHALSGFSAKLTPGELDHIRDLDGFVHASVSKRHNLHTTHSPSFLHLNRESSGFWAKSAKYGEGAIIGVLDTGIAPTHSSFHGARMSTPPSKWKGACNFSGGTFPCNNKIIGGRSFHEGREVPIPPNDENGHGTHVAGIAAGQFVKNASVLGSAMGTAAGMAPNAHLAVYKVCDLEGSCPTEDITSGIDMALSDGVDVISISIGLDSIPVDEDPTLTSNAATFAAVKRGVFVAMSAGNEGPPFLSVGNIFPWVLTVGASTMDRRIRAVVKLGNGTELVGESAYQPSDIPDYLPLIFPHSSGDVHAPFCTKVSTLEHIGVKGKIVVCRGGLQDPVEAGRLVKEAGGAAMIFWGSKKDGYLTNAYAHEIRASYVTHSDGMVIYEYHKSMVNAKAMIRFEGTVIGGSSDPAVAPFSSRGPGGAHHEILKPDIIGPGVDVLSAAPPSVGAFHGHLPFVMKDGTSMSCPHLAGVAALLKSSHPDWSPAMIKSAIMTTADVTNSGCHHILDSYDNKKASFYAMGAGHVNPVKANNPGLVYDIQHDDYISYLCGLEYTNDQVRVIVSNHTISCADYTSVDEVNLNYPSIVAFLAASNSFAGRITRTLTNVGSANTTYTAHVRRPHGITIDVRPRVLHFSAVGQKRSFSVLFGMNETENAYRTSEGVLIWTSSVGSFEVKSPTVVWVL